MYIWKVVSWQHRKEGAGIVWQRTVIPVSNQISNKLLLLVGIRCRTSLTLEMSQAHWKTFWEEMDEYSFSKGFLVCRHCSICSSSHEYFFFYIVYATQYITLTAAKAAGNTALAYISMVSASMGLKRDFRPLFLSSFITCCCFVSPVSISMVPYDPGRLLGIRCCLLEMASSWFTPAMERENRTMAFFTFICKGKKRTCNSNL